MSYAADMQERIQQIPIEIKPYPLPFSAGSLENSLLIARDLAELVNELQINFPRQHFFDFVWSHFQNAEKHFAAEEILRKDIGLTNADLFYHGKEHALYQTTYDTVALLRAVNSRKDRLSRHLKPEMVAASLLGAVYHDIGYVYAANPANSFAARTPIHVDKGIEAFEIELRRCNIPQFLNIDNIIKLGRIGIRNTNFPYTDKHVKKQREELDLLTPEMRKEAHITRLIVQFADLGGQVARVDYYPNLIKALRSEMNSANSGKGTEIIGEDHQLAKKCRGFIQFVVEKMLRKTGNAFLKTVDHAYQRAWDKQGREEDLLVA